MKTVHLQTVIGADGKLHLELPSDLPPGPVEVVVVIAPTTPEEGKHSWRDFLGIGKEIWAGEDAQEYVNRLRAEWDR